MLPSRPQILPKKGVAGGKRFDNLYGRRRLRHRMILICLHLNFKEDSSLQWTRCMDSRYIGEKVPSKADTKLVLGFGILAQSLMHGIQAFCHTSLSRANSRKCRNNAVEFDNAATGEETERLGFLYQFQSAEYHSQDLYDVTKLMHLRSRLTRAAWQAVD
ncbi:hypothetical protein T4E_1387 [Trichinella pseudospiralis]|uniref:Uncharacterized protein n=1 Tax=Trichinella pseudospiralis TaxID=6337 RepID=A0A0V0XVV5_TRIPS|nr:hypothetical protein T4E_1387 [Trichinella pseudospiralis]